ANAYPNLIGLFRHRGLDVAGGRHCLRRPPDDGGKIPDDEAARGHQETREYEKCLPPQRVMAEERVLTKPRHEGSKDRIAEEKHGNRGAESQRQRNLPSEPLVPERPRFRRRGSLESRWRVRLENHAPRGSNISSSGQRLEIIHVSRTPSRG